ncbi:MAG TPA: hypothetical protein VGB08_00235 [Allosphingosinicella sp.]
MRAPGAFWSTAAALALAGCGGSGGDAANEAAAPEAMPTEEELARDAELANEAAADDAADMNNFGGSAAEMDLRNEQ